MAIVVTLSPELETLLRNRAAQQGQEVDRVASELLSRVLKRDEQELEQSIKGIQKGLADFEAGRSRSFHEFAEEQRQKYNLSADS